MRERVVVIDPGYGSYDIERDWVTGAGFSFEVNEAGGSREDRKAFARGAVGMFVRGTIVDDDLLKDLPCLRAIVRYGVGVDNIDVKAATARGIRVANVQGYANHSVSDHALALILSCMRGIARGTRMVRGQYGQLPFQPMLELREATLGIVGLGHIGSTLCQKAIGLFDRVVACDPYVPADRFREVGAVRVDLDELLRVSDAISLHCSCTEETRGLIGREALAKMARCPVLVNTARGAVVDEVALCDALRDERVRAAGLDIFSEEPPGLGCEALLSHPNVVATGHYAWYSRSADENLKRRAGQNMILLLQGQCPEDCLNPGEG